MFLETFSFINYCIHKLAGAIIIRILYLTSTGNPCHTICGFASAENKRLSAGPITGNRIHYSDRVSKEEENIVMLYLLAAHARDA